LEQKRSKAAFQSLIRWKPEISQKAEFRYPVTLHPIHPNDMPVRRLHGMVVA
jgi:hypothetical protein